MAKKILITGGAGYIGIDLAKTLLEEGNKVVIVDKLSLQRKQPLAKYLKNKKLRSVKGDLLKIDKIRNYFRGVDLVVHLAANTNTKVGYEKTDLDLKKGTLITYNVLEAMRLNSVKEIIFTSSVSVYGNAEVKPTPEDYGPLLPMSMYAASKLASEALISAYHNNFGITAWIFRLTNVIGKDKKTGVVFDFIKKLKKDSSTLLILGNGRQKRPYLYIDDCVNGILCGYKNSDNGINLYNLSCEDTVTVDEIADYVLMAMKLGNVKKIYSGGNVGWTGDTPEIKVNVDRLRKLRWKAKYNSHQAVQKAIHDLLSTWG